MELKISAVMISNDRFPRKSYVEKSLQSLQDSGFFENPNFSFTLINTSPDSRRHINFLEKFGNNVQVIDTDSKFNFHKAMVFALEHGSKVECSHIIFMEDDIKVCRNFPERVFDFVATHGNQQMVCDFSTPYLEIVTNFYQGASYWDIESGDFYGTQCLAFRKDAARSFASFIKRETGTRPGYPDTWFLPWLEEAYGIKTIRCAVPSLAQHTGEESTQDNTFFTVPGFADDLEVLFPENYRPMSQEDHQLVSLKDGAEVLDIKTGITIAKINNSGLMVYSLCDGRSTLKEITLSLVNDFPENEQQIRNQVPMTISELMSSGLLS